MKTENGKLHASVLKSNGIDLSMDYFSLSHEQQRVVSVVRKAFKYSGKNNVGRFADQQFYYHCQHNS